MTFVLPLCILDVNQCSCVAVDSSKRGGVDGGCRARFQPPHCYVDSADVSQRQTSPIHHWRQSRWVYIEHLSAI